MKVVRATDPKVAQLQSDGIASASMCQHDCDLQEKLQILFERNLGGVLRQVAIKLYLSVQYALWNDF